MLCIARECSMCRKTGTLSTARKGKWVSFNAKLAPPLRAPGLGVLVQTVQPVDSPHGRVDRVHRTYSASLRLTSTPGVIGGLQLIFQMGQYPLISLQQQKTCSCAALLSYVWALRFAREGGVVGHSAEERRPRRDVSPWRWASSTEHSHTIDCQ